MDLELIALHLQENTCLKFCSLGTKGSDTRMAMKDTKSLVLLYKYTNKVHAYTRPFHKLLQISSAKKEQHAFLKKTNWVFLAACRSGSEVLLFD